MVGQQLVDGVLVEAKADFGLLAEQAEAGHGRFDCVHIDAPQIDEKDDFELELGVFGHGNVGAHVGVVFIVQEEEIAEQQNLAKPREV